MQKVPHVPRVELVQCVNMAAETGPRAWRAAAAAGIPSQKGKTRDFVSPGKLFPKS